MDLRLLSLKETYPEAWDCFEQHGIHVVTPNSVPGLGETRAIGTLDRIIRRHKRPHADFVVLTLSDSQNNRNAIDETTLWALSDMVRACQLNYPAIMENDIEAWFDFWDRTPLAVLADWCHDLDGIVPKRYNLGGMLWERLKRRFDKMAAQPDLLDDRRMTA